jgi:nodulation protein A
MTPLTFQTHPTLPDPERRALFEWGPDVFQGSLYQLRWRAAELHVVGYLDGAPVTHVGLVRQTVGVGKDETVVGGVGGVVTVPSRQKQGLARQCLVKSHEVMRSEFGVAHGFLFCPDGLLKFYGGAGWKQIFEKVMIDQPQGKVTAPLLSMVMSFSAPWPSGTVDLRSLPW